jgi:hypothetical protein
VVKDRLDVKLRFTTAEKLLRAALTVFDVEIFDRNDSLLIADNFPLTHPLPNGRETSHQRLPHAGA